MAGTNPAVVAVFARALTTFSQPYGNPPHHPWESLAFQGLLGTAAAPHEPEPPGSRPAQPIRRGDRGPPQGEGGGDLMMMNI